MQKHHPKYIWKKKFICKDTISHQLLDFIKSLATIWWYQPILAALAQGTNNEHAVLEKSWNKQTIHLQTVWSLLTFANRLASEIGFGKFHILRLVDVQKLCEIGMSEFCHLFLLEREVSSKIVFYKFEVLCSFCLHHEEQKNQIRWDSTASIYIREKWSYQCVKWSGDLHSFFPCVVVSVDCCAHLVLSFIENRSLRRFLPKGYHAFVWIYHFTNLKKATVHIDISIPLVVFRLCWHQGYVMKAVRNHGTVLTTYQFPRFRNKKYEMRK